MRCRCGCLFVDRVVDRCLLLLVLLTLCQCRLCAMVIVMYDTGAVGVVCCFVGVIDVCGLLCDRGVLWCARLVADLLVYHYDAGCGCWCVA